MHLTFREPSFEGEVMSDPKETVETITPEPAAEAVNEPAKESGELADADLEKVSGGRSVTIF
jgi:hypothetical protein